MADAAIFDPTNSGRRAKRAIQAQRLEEQRRNYEWPQGTTKKLRMEGITSGSHYEWKALRVEGITNGRYYEWKVYCILPFGVIPKLLRTDALGFPNQTYGGLCLERFHQSMLKSSWGFVWRGSDVDPVLISQKSAQNGSLRLARIRVCPQRVSVEEMLLRRYSHPRHVS